MSVVDGQTNMSRFVGRDDQRVRLCQPAIYVAFKYKKAETLSSFLFHFFFARVLQGTLSRNTEIRFTFCLFTIRSNIILKVKVKVKFSL